jgi:NTP pyrophosphatase (non-canonical NTP hydrolase)
MMGKHFNGLTPAEAERLALLAEEMGEAIQVIGKILRHGYESTHPGGGPTNRGLLEKELGDVQAAITMMAHNTDVDLRSISSHREEKMENVKRYLHHQAF